MAPQRALDHGWIAAHVPHHGSMCLLDAVVEWDADSASCRATSHRDARNPLRLGDRLGVACGVEYAAQAMAVHGALCAVHAAPRAGMLVSARAVRWHVERLDDIADDLLVHVVRLHGDDTALHYAFSVRAGTRALLDGQAMVLCAPDQPRAAKAPAP